MIKSFIPGVMKDVTSVVSQQLYIDSLLVIAVAKRAHQLRARLLSWRSNHQKSLGDSLSCICTGGMERDSRFKIMGVYHSCLMLLNRLIAAISPSEQQKREEEAQQLAMTMLELQEHIALARPQASIFVAQAVGLARVMVATTQDWQTTPEYEEKSLGSNRRVISRWKFERWCEMFGRKM
jgi:hypothetical protein